MMKTPLAVACLSWSVLLVGCATGSGGAGSGSSGMPVPVGVPTGGIPSTGSGSASSTSAGTGATAMTETGDSASTKRADGSADPGMTAKTAAERQADLDGKLDASLNNFDEKLRNEQQRSANERDSGASARAEGAVVDATSNGERDKDEIQRDRSGDLQSAGLEQDDSRQASELSQKGGGGASAKPIPNGSNDDIIARRLRRAAENETDPELREKLWDEYRDYKENTKGSK
jgi:hypothetical protein